MSNRFKSLLLGSMIAFASATEFAKGDKYEYAWRRRAEFRRQKRQRAKEVTYYSGPINKLLPYHLDNTGSLVKVYRPKLFVPSINLVAISNITPKYELKSDIFRIYKFGNPDILLPGSDKILLPSNKQINHVMSLFNTFDKQKSNTVIDTCFNQILNLKDLQSADAKHIYEAMNDKFELLSETLVKEVSYIRHDFEVLSSSIKEQHRVLTDDIRRFNQKDLNQRAVDHASEPIKKHIGKMLLPTPARLGEHAVDAMIFEAAGHFAKIIAESFFM